MTLKNLRDNFDKHHTKILYEVLDISNEKLDELIEYRPYAYNDVDVFMDDVVPLPDDALVISKSLLEEVDKMELASLSKGGLTVYQVDGNDDEDEVESIEDKLYKFYNEGEWA